MRRFLLRLLTVTVLAVSAIGLVATAAIAQTGPPPAPTGFDLGSAVVLGLVVMGLVSLAYNLVKGTGEDRVKVLVCLAVSVVAVLLVGASDFAETEVVLNRPLSSLNIASQLIVALLAAGVASTFWTVGAKALSRIGSQAHL